MREKGILERIHIEKVRKTARELGAEGGKGGGARQKNDIFGSDIFEICITIICQQWIAIMPTFYSLCANRIQSHRS